MVITKAYHTSSETYIQILIERFNATIIKEGENVIEHVNKLSTIANYTGKLNSWYDASFSYFS